LYLSPLQWQHVQFSLLFLLTEALEVIVQQIKEAPTLQGTKLYIFMQIFNSDPENLMTMDEDTDIFGTSSTTLSHSVRSFWLITESESDTFTKL
jgi:hypothetical protein